MSEPKTVKEIAAAIRRGTYFVRAAKAEMKKQGIDWELGRIRVDVFLAWVKANNFKSTNYWRKISQNQSKSDTTVVAH